MLIKIANRIGKAHAEFFGWLSQRAAASIWFALALTLYALYEIFEHIALPIIATLWATGTIGVK
jgi:hypothetical protein